MSNSSHHYDRVQRILGRIDVSEMMYRGALSAAQIESFVAIDDMRHEADRIAQSVYREPPERHLSEVRRMNDLNFLYHHRLDAFMSHCQAEFNNHELFEAGFTVVVIGPGFGVFLSSPEEEE